MIKNLIRNQLVRKAIKFGLVGGTAFVVSYLTYVALCKYHLLQWGSIEKKNYLFYSAIGDIAGLLVGYVLNKKWTFRHHTQEEEKYFLRYFTVYAFTFVINKLILMLVIEYFTFVPHRLYVAPILATAVSAALNFIGTNVFVFKSNTK